MISAMILPASKIDDLTVDQVVTRALESGLVACNKLTGPFRISFFPKNRVPQGWARIGITDKTPEVPPCAA